MHHRPFRFTRRTVAAGALVLTAIFGLCTVGTGTGVFLEHDAIATAQAALPNVVVPPESVALTPERTPAITNSTAVDDDRTVTLTTGRTTAKRKPNRYRFGYPMVAFGDSTMALAPTERRTNPFGSCSHYTRTWPLQVSESLHLPLADLSCSGAKTGAYWQKQLDKYLGPGTQLVVVSYGSNDLRVVFQLLNDNGLPGTGPRFKGKTRQEVEGSLVKILRDVRKRAPNAMILTVGYLPLVQEAQCKTMPNMTQTETERVRHLRENADIALTNSTNQVAKLSEQQWASQGIQVVAPGIYNVPFRKVHGHDLCAKTAQRFILNMEKKGVRYHYTTKGLNFIADRVLRKYWSEQQVWQRQVRYFVH